MNRCWLFVRIPCGFFELRCDPYYYNYNVYDLQQETHPLRVPAHNKFGASMVNKTRPTQKTILLMKTRSESARERKTEVKVSKRKKRAEKKEVQVVEKKEQKTKRPKQTARMKCENPLLITEAQMKKFFPDYENSN